MPSIPVGGRSSGRRSARAAATIVLAGAAAGWLPAACVENPGAAVAVDTAQLDEATKEQRDQLVGAPKWVDKAKGVVQVPIETAKSAVVADLTRDPTTATEPEPPKPAPAASSGEPAGSAAPAGSGAPAGSASAAPSAKAPAPKPPAPKPPAPPQP